MTTAALVPAEPKLETWLLHAFVHDDVAAVVINLLFLFLAGYSLEERWGRALFLLFFCASVGLTAGTLVHLDGGSRAPWLGAAGAVSGLLGAFTARFGATRIRCAYFLLLWRGIFRAPALLLLVFWLGAEYARAVWWCLNAHWFKQPRPQLLILVSFERLELGF